MMRARLIIAIFTTLLAEAVLLVLGLWVLPQLGVNISLWVVIILMLVWVVYAVTIYRVGSRALKRKPVAGLTAMVGSRGKVVEAIAPEGFISIGGELWRAIAAGESKIEVGEEVTVVEQDGLKLAVVKKSRGEASVDE